jgi:TIR domain
LLIGCDFADWLSRFFIRLSNKDRLSSSERDTREFLAGGAALEDHSFTEFLNCYSRNSKIYRGVDAASFVSELLRRWREAPRPPGVQKAADVRTPSFASGPGNVFVSYARENLEAAERLRSQLETIGGADPWFDKRKLTPGDEWERTIPAAIKSCDIFLPLLSAETERRVEGYFWREWNEADDRSRNMSPTRKFIIPVVTDREWRGRDSDYKEIPNRFRKYQFTHAPAGQMSEELRKVVASELKRNWQRSGKT